MASENKSLFSFPLSQPTLAVIMTMGVIIGIAFSSYFYFQNLAEISVRDALLEQQKLRQIDNTEAISERLSSDLDSIAKTLQLLASQPPLQRGELSSEETTRLIRAADAELNQITPILSVGVHDSEDVIVNNSQEKYRYVTGLDRSNSTFVIETRKTMQPYVSNVFNGATANMLTVSAPIINEDTGEYIGLVVTGFSAVEFFERYGNLQDIQASTVIALDRRGVVFTSAIPDFIGQDYFGEKIQTAINRNPELNRLYGNVLSGKPDSAIFTANLGERFSSGVPVFYQDEQVMSVFTTTPTTAIYSQIDDILAATTLRYYIMLSAVSAAIIILIFFLVRWNKSLDAMVNQRTAELKESNAQLAQANAVLSEYNVQLGNAYEQVVKANEQLEVNNKMQKEFINIAAHELRTPVQPLLGLAEIIAKSAKDADKIEVTKPELEMIVRNAERLERLSNNILEVSRIETRSLKLHKEAVDLNKEIKEVVSDSKTFIRPDKEVKIIVELSDNPIILTADKPRLYEVISNLVNNAIKFTDSGTITVKAEKQDDYAVVSVKDTGSGIDPEIMPRLFTRFFSKSETGTGLGLYIAKSIVEAHDGKIWGENNHDGSGATFSFSLTLQPPQELKSH